MNYTPEDTSKQRPSKLKNILFYYIPMLSGFSYMAVVLEYTNPDLEKSPFDRSGHDLLLPSILVGFTLYIYSRPYLKAARTIKKIAYSVIGSYFFFMGSMLMFWLAHDLMPKNSSFSTIGGLISGAGLLKLGYDYLNENVGSRD